MMILSWNVRGLGGWIRGDWLGIRFKVVVQILWCFKRFKKKVIPNRLACWVLGAESRFIRVVYSACYWHFGRNYACVESNQFGEN